MSSYPLVFKKSLISLLLVFFVFFSDTRIIYISMLNNIAKVFC